MAEENAVNDFSAIASLVDTLVKENDELHKRLEVAQEGLQTIAQYDMSKKLHTDGWAGIDFEVRHDTLIEVARARLATLKRMK